MNSKNELSVVCLLWGGWASGKGIEYVNKLYRGVKRNLSIPHRFICFADKYSDKFDHRIEVIPLDVPDRWMWNFKKMYLYKPNNGLTGRVLALDLDMVMVGRLDEIALHDSWFTTCRGAYHHEGEKIKKVGGSIIGFNAGDELLTKLLWNPLSNGNKLRKKYEKITGGSERKYFALRLRDIEFWQDQFPNQILSYKVDVRGKNKIHEDARIIRFHGKPRPHEVNQESFVKENWI